MTNLSQVTYPCGCKGHGFNLPAECPIHAAPGGKPVKEEKESSNVPTR